LREKTISLKEKGKEGISGISIFAGQNQDIDNVIEDLRQRYQPLKVNVIVKDILISGKAGKKVILKDNEDPQTMQVLWLDTSSKVLNSAR